MNERLAEWGAALESSIANHTGLWLFAWTLFYVMNACSRAVQKPFWFDEIFTITLSRLDPATLWKALSQGVDLSPPGIYLLTRLSHSLFGGEGQITSRLPSLIAYWVMSLCVFQFVRRRIGPLYGLGAMLLVGLTSAFPYSFEARPYALVIAFCAIALVCWQAVGDGQRGLALLGMGLSLAAAVSLHYYAALLFAAFGVGELARTMVRRRIDYATWASLIGSSLTILIYVPLIISTRAYFKGFITKPTVEVLQLLYHELLPATFLFFCVPVLCLIVVLIAFDTDAPPRPSISIPLDEVVICTALALLPMLCWTISKLLVGQVLFRYTLSASIGISLMILYAIALIRPSRAYIGLLVILLCGNFAFRSVKTATEVYPWNPPSPDMFLYSSLAKPIADNLPIVNISCYEMLNENYYRRGALKDRIHCVADQERSFRATGKDNIDRASLSLQKWADVKVEPFDQFVAAHKDFWMYGMTSKGDWIVPTLRSMGATLELENADNDWLLMRVHLPK